MGVASVKNEIKTLFLIINTTNVIATGLFPLSGGVALLINIQHVQDRLGIAFCLITGLGMLCITTLGSYGAIHERKAILDAYLVLAGLTALLEVGVSLYITGVYWMDSFVFIIFHPTVPLISMALAVILSKQARRDWSPSAPAATAL